MSIAGLVTGTATGVGSLPHRDAEAAAALVLRELPDLPAAPQLPNRSPSELMLAQALEPDFDSDAYAGLRAFLLPRAGAARVKVQTVGPLTLGVGLHDEFLRATEIVIERGRALVVYTRARLPNVEIMLWFDEPSLRRWQGGDGPITRDEATEYLTAAVAAIEVPTGVHVCTEGDVQLAIEAQPDILHVDVRSLTDDDSAALAAFVDRGGWIAWGAVPSDRPIPDAFEPLAERLFACWDECARRGVDRDRIAAQALVAPACGLAQHSVVDAGRALRLACEIGERVRATAGPNTTR